VNGGGEPAITLKPAGMGTTNGNFYVDIKATNIGTGVARNLIINSLTFKTITGTGSVTLNTALSPALPDNLGSLNVGGTATVRLYLNVPAGVTLFMITDNGTFSDVAGKTLAYAAGQAVIY
jgi:hypothetical protein